MNDLLDRLTADAHALADRPVYAQSGTGLYDVVDTIQTIINCLTATQATVLHEIDGQGLIRSSGATSPATWLRDRVRISLPQARQIAALGTLLHSRTDLAAVAAAGDLTPGQALAIGDVLADLPDDCGPALVDQAATILIDHARQFEPAILRKLGDRVLAHLAPDLADAELQRRLDRDERAANRDRTLTLTPDGRGRTRLHGILDTEAAATVRAALEPLMTPLPAGPAGADLRTPAARRADALVAVCRLALRTGELPADGGQPAQLTVTIDYTALAASVGAGSLDTGEALSAAVVRRLACDAKILPVVLDGHGVPIDVGRARRLYTGATRTAVLLRDRGCAFPGCDRPPKWCDIHHIRSWIDGGDTNRDNGVALCQHHHRLIHRDTWTITIGADGHPTFTPPPGIDPDQTLRRNPYHQRT